MYARDPAVIEVAVSRFSKALSQLETLPAAHFANDLNKVLRMTYQASLVPLLPKIRMNKSVILVKR